ncbi:MAG: Hsp33 family molecular chaperone HslO [Firmicutes bacterium]|nr:Hsp33 family molecular chaperone HslO [Bacillota bacterium]
MNKVLTAIDKSGSFRVYLTISTELVQEAADIHNTTPLATAALGRVLTGAGLMGLLLKNEQDKLTVIFKGDGPAKQILSTSDGRGRVKGYIANPDVDLPLKENGKLDVGGSLGIGELTVIKDLGLKDPYVGTISLVSGEIAEDLTAYYYISEQQNSAISLGVKIERDLSVGCAGGMIIQMLPGACEEAVEALERLINSMEPITALIDRVKEQMPKGQPEDMVRTLAAEIFKDMPEEFSLDILDIKEIQWQCDCSEERLEKVLMTIGVKDLTEIIEEDGKAELVCQFCLKKYNFDKAHLGRILASIK